MKTQNQTNRISQTDTTSYTDTNAIGLGPFFYAWAWGIEP